MPSPVLMLALVVNGKTLPQPPVHRMTALRGDRLDPAGRQLDGDDAVHPAVVDEQPGDEPLVVARDRVVLQRGLEQRVQHVEAGLVGGEPGAHLLHAAERRGRRRGRPARRLHGQPQCSSCSSSARRLLDERLDGVLVAQPVAAGDGVVGVLVEAVVRGDHAGGAALGRDRVAAHRVDLRDDGHPQGRVGLGDGDGRAQAGAAAADDEHVVGGRHRAVTHRGALRRPAPCRGGCTIRW